MQTPTKTSSPATSTTAAPKPPQHLLVCVDVHDASGCDLAHGLVEHAAVLATALNARLTIFSAVPPLTTPATPPVGGETAAYKSLLDTATAQSNGWRRVVQTLTEHVRARGLTVDSRVVEVDGNAAGAIVGAAVDFAADLIVVASHSRRGLLHVVLGSVAEQVVRRSPVAVVVVPRAALG